MSVSVTPSRREIGKIDPTTGSGIQRSRWKTRSGKTCSFHGKKPPWGPLVIIGGWIATVVAALWIGSRVGKEIAYGVLRFTNRKAVEAVPPKPEG